MCTWSLIAVSMLIRTASVYGFVNNSYMVLCPDTVRPGMEFTVQFHKLLMFPDVQEYQLVAEIVNETESIAKREVTLSNATTSAQLVLQLPQNLPSANYTLELEAKDNVSTIFENSTSLRYTSKAFSIFIQTDKGVYKPGQKVRFRAFATKPDLSTVHGKMDITVFDPDNNKIDQWLSQEEPSDVFQEELLLSNEPIIGDWKIDVELLGSTKSVLFTVEEYVLPLFEVTVTVPSLGLTFNNFLSGKVEAKYTIGNGVAGNGVIIIKRKNIMNKEFRLTFNVTGIYNFDVEIQTLVNLFGNLNNVQLDIVAEVTEALTGNTQSGSAEIQFYDMEEKLVFLNGADTFKPGSGFSYTCYLFLSDQHNIPLATVDSQVNISASMTLKPAGPGDATSEISKDIVKGSKSIPSNGIIPVTLSIPGGVTNITIKANYGNLQAVKEAIKFQAKSSTYIQVSVKTKNPKVGEICAFTIKSTKRKITVNLLIISKGLILKVDMIKIKKRTKTLKVMMSADMAPSARVVVYWVKSDGEVIGDARQFKVEDFFKNKVDIDFSNQRGRTQTKGSPNQKVQIRVTADPGSQCNVLVLDQSVPLIKSGNDITTAKVAEEFEMYDSDAFAPCRGSFPSPMLLSPFAIPGVDVSAMFQNSALKVMTDAGVYQSEQPCDAPVVDSEGPSAPPRVNKKSPETWIYRSAIANDRGTAIIDSRVPDTLTTWVASAFAVNNETGLGVAPNTANFQAFLKFFIRLELPYSVTRGEQVLLRAHVFNFLSINLTVDVVLKKSKSFKAIIIHGNATGTRELVQKSVEVTRTIMVSPGEVETVYLPIVAVKLGNIDISVKATSGKAGDTVKKQLLVEPEGIPLKYNIPVLIGLTNSGSFHKKLMITLPDNYIKDSVRIRISVQGDLTGHDISSLSNLLRMPFGCGEQNMIKFVPNVVIIKYLEAIGKLTPEDKNKAINFIKTGYQTELSYQRTDGTFSAFGNDDQSGSTWLTAYVVKSLTQASSYIFIDPAVMANAIGWLLKLYNENGGFWEYGRIIHSGMQGGTEAGEQNLAAYTVIALMEAVSAGFSSDMWFHQTVISHSLGIMEGAVSSMENTFQLAITGYAMALANKTKLDDILTKLEAKATMKDGMKYWVMEEEPDLRHLKWAPPHQQASSRNIETTAYVLLIYATKGDIVNGLLVLKWLMNQRNGNGGFGTTHDTVIALEALAKFAALIYSPGGNNMTVDIAGTPKRFSHSFIDSTDIDAMTLQSVDAPAGTRELSVNTTGNGIALLEVVVYYNVRLDFMEPMFDLQLNIQNEEMDYLELHICFRWLGDGESGMAILEITLLSGFMAEKDSITHDLIDRKEEKDKKLFIYLDKVPSIESTCLDVPMQRVGLVTASKPAVVELYEYYENKKRASGMYKSLLLEGADVCSLGEKELEEIGC